MICSFPGTWRLKRATTADEKLVLMEAKHLESTSTLKPQQPRTRLSPFTSLSSGSHVFPLCRLDSGISGEHKPDFKLSQEGTTINRFALPSYKFAVISNPKKVDSHALSPVRLRVRFNTVKMIQFVTHTNTHLLFPFLFLLVGFLQVPENTPVGSPKRGHPSFPENKPSLKTNNDNKPSLHECFTLPSFSKTELSSPLCSEHEDSYSDSDTDIEISWTSKKSSPAQETSPKKHPTEPCILASIAADAAANAVDLKQEEEKQEEEEEDDFDTESDTESESEFEFEPNFQVPETTAHLQTKGCAQHTQSDKKSADPITSELLNRILGTYFSFCLDFLQKPKKKEITT